jgi:hypothetical protein
MSKRTLVVDKPYEFFPALNFLPILRVTDYFQRKSSAALAGRQGFKGNGNSYDEWFAFQVHRDFVAFFAFATLG